MEPRSLRYCDYNHDLLISLNCRLGERRGEGNQKQGKAVEIS
jgi:hypothetical protein